MLGGTRVTPYFGFKKKKKSDKKTAPPPPPLAQGLDTPLEWYTCLTQSILDNKAVKCLRMCECCKDWEACFHAVRTILLP